MHISAHCVANAPKNTTVEYSYLFRTDHGGLRLYRAGDPCTQAAAARGLTGVGPPARATLPTQRQHRLHIPLQQRQKCRVPRLVHVVHVPQARLPDRRVGRKSPQPTG